MTKLQSLSVHKRDPRGIVTLNEMKSQTVRQNRLLWWMLPLQNQRWDFLWRVWGTLFANGRFKNRSEDGTVFRVVVKRGSYCKITAAFSLQNKQRLSRTDLKILVRLLTGHNTLNRHLTVWCKQSFNKIFFFNFRCTVIDKWLQIIMFFDNIIKTKCFAKL